MASKNKYAKLQEMVEELKSEHDREMKDNSSQISELRERNTKLGEENNRLKNEIRCLQERLDTVQQYTFSDFKNSDTLIQRLSMSNSKLLPPFTFDVLCYLNRDQLERFSIVCRSLKNIIGRYFNSKPYRIFDGLRIYGGDYALIVYDLEGKRVQWHPNREDYSVQQFFDYQKCSIDDPNHYTFYSFAEMRPYLGPTVRIKKTWIFVAGGSVYNPEHITEMESIAYLWCDSYVSILNSENEGSRIVAEDFLPILNSPAILKCQYLYMENAHFSFKDYKVLYAVNIILINYRDEEIGHSYWPEFLEQPGVKPVVFLHQLPRESINKVLDQLTKAFSSAVSPNAFKILLVKNDQPLTEFRESNYKSRERLELKKGLPMEYHLLNEYLKQYHNYTLERSSF